MLDIWLPQKEKRWHAEEAWPKKERKREKRGNHVMKKRGMIKEREPMFKGVPPSIYPSIQPHTCTFWSRLYDLFLHVFSLWLYNIWNASIPCSYPTLSSTKALPIVGKTKGNYCPDENNKSWVLRENHFGNLAMFLKILFKKISPDGLQNYEQVSIALRTVLTLNNPRQGDGY